MNSHHKDTKHTQRHEVQLVAILHGVGLSLLALHLYVRNLPLTSGYVADEAWTHEHGPLSWLTRVPLPGNLARRRPAFRRQRRAWIRT